MPRTVRHCDNHTGIAPFRAWVSTVRLRWCLLHLPYIALLPGDPSGAKPVVCSVPGRMVTPGARLRPRRRGTGLLPCLALTLAAVAAVVASTAALNFKVQPNDELCFHEITHKGTAVTEWVCGGCVVGVWWACGGRVVGAACFVRTIAGVRTVGFWVQPWGKAIRGSGGDCPSSLDGDLFLGQAITSSLRLDSHALGLATWF